MSIQLKIINKNASIAQDVLDFSLPAATASGTVVFGRYSPKFPFVIVKVQFYALSATNLTSVDAGTAPTAGGTYTSVLSSQIAYAADTEQFGTLVSGAYSSVPQLYGTATSQIIVKYTASAAGTAVNSFVSVTIRPRPMDGDPVF